MDIRPVFAGCWPEIMEIKGKTVEIFIYAQLLKWNQGKKQENEIYAQELKLKQGKK